MASKSSNEAAPNTAAESIEALPQVDAVASDVATQLTLTEFCIRLSQRDRRVTLIGGFESVERKSGQVKDTEKAYQSRYSDFINQPA